MENPHLILPEPEESKKEQDHTMFIIVCSVLIIALMALIVSSWNDKVTYLQKQLTASQTHVEVLRTQNTELLLENDKLSQENTSLKCDLYFYKQQEGKEK